MAAVISPELKLCQPKPGVSNVLYCGQVAQQERRYVSSVLVVRFPLAKPVPREKRRANSVLYYLRRAFLQLLYANTTETYGIFM